MKILLRYLLFIFILMLGLQCSHRPYQPNYNTKTNHNAVVKERNRMVTRQAKHEIKRSNKQRAKARRSRKAKRENKKAAKYAKKLIK